MAFSESIIYLFNFSLGATAVLAFFVIIAAGIKMVESRGNPSETQSAKQKIINSLIGLTVILTSYILLTTINPDIINIQNISLGTTGITIPIITPEPEPETKIKNYEFQEIPIGTLTEAILAGTSSQKNAVPCYEYEHKAYDNDGNVIIGNTVDRNKDGKIDEKDVLLNKDMFYCIKLLDDAIQQKINVHLNTLIAGARQLDDLMKTNCSCKRAHYDYLAPDTTPYELGGDACSPPGCYYGITHCQCCGDANAGCRAAEEDAKLKNSCDSTDNPCEVVATSGAKEYKQYDYDTCDNRLAIDCKRQEIEELMGGSKPDKICYESINGRDPLIKKEQPFNLLTIEDGIERLDKFKEYYDKEIKALEDAELKMKEPYGEKITLAEVYNYVETRKNVSVTQKTFQTNPYVYYNIARYCRESNCTKYADADEKICLQYELSVKKRVCMMEATAEDVKSKTLIGSACEKAVGLAELNACKEYYSYSGDGATFYYSAEYNEDYKQENQIIDSSDNKCNIENQEIAKEMYGGLIRIGETVDYTEVWGKEVSKRIEKIKEEVQGMYKTGMAIASFPDSCNGNSCTNSSPDKLNICTDRKSVCNCKSSGSGPNCCCAPVSGIACTNCEAKETICKKIEIEDMNVIGNVTTCPEKEKKPYDGCSTCCGLCAKVNVPQEDYWTCPYRSLCMLMKDLYQTRNISGACFQETEDAGEAGLREINKSKVGYVQKMMIREAMLFELAQVKEIKDDKEYENIPTADLISTICPTYLDLRPLSDLYCDATKSKKLNLWKRFDLFEMLRESRDRLTGCVTGYNYPYKEAADNVRVMSAYEAANTSLDILPEFPYPDKSKENPPYLNSYPYNSDSLTDEEKEKCFYNINRMGDSSNPGCLMITKSYMDNYYCCQ